MNRSSSKLKPIAPRPSTQQLNQGFAGPAAILSVPGMPDAMAPVSGLQQVSMSQLPPAGPVLNRNAYVGLNLGVPATALEAMTSMDPKDYVWGQPGTTVGTPLMGPGGQVVGAPAMYHPGAAAPPGYVGAPHSCYPSQPGLMMQRTGTDTVAGVQDTGVSQPPQQDGQSAALGSAQGVNSTGQSALQGSNFGTDGPEDANIDDLYLDDGLLRLLSGGVTEDEAGSVERLMETGPTSLSEKGDEKCNSGDSAATADPKLAGQTGGEARSTGAADGEPAASDLLDIDSVFAMDEASDLRGVGSFADLDLEALACIQELESASSEPAPPADRAFKRSRSTSAVDDMNSGKAYNPLLNLKLEDALSAMHSYIKIVPDDRVPTSKKEAALAAILSLKPPTSPQRPVVPKRKRSTVAPRAAAGGGAAGGGTGPGPRLRKSASSAAV